MPPPKDAYAFAYREFPWIEDLDSECLRKVVVEALLARESAVHADGDPGLIKSGTKTLEALRYGKYKGDVACQKASTALRKFSRAQMVVSMPRMAPGTRGA